MKYLVIVLCAFCSLISAGEPGSYRGWFAGAQIGIAENDESDKTIIGVHGGYRFNQYFSVEMVYLDLDEIGIRSSGSESTADIYGFRYGAVGMLPLTSRLSWMVSAGLFHHRISEEVSRDFTVFTTATETVGPYAETGLDLRLNGGWSTRVTVGEYEIDPYDFEFNGGELILDDDQDLRLYQLGFSYRF